MRVRTIAIVVVGVLAFFAVTHNVRLADLRDPRALILQMHNSPLRFALTTEPKPPNYDTPVTLKVHVVDAAGKPADRLTVDAYISMSSRLLTLRGKGNGDYEGRADLDMEGTWDVDLTAMKDGIKSEQRISIEVFAPPPQSTTHDDDDS
jgi:hypothetical protein